MHAFWITLSLTLLAAACSSPADSPQNPVVVEIADQRFYADAFRQYVRRRLSDLGDQAFDHQLRDQFLRDFTDEQLLMREARRSGIAVDSRELEESVRRLGPSELAEADAADLKRNLEESLIVQKFIRERIRPRIQVSLEEARAYFNTHASEFARPETLLVREILVEGSSEAHRLQRLVRSSPASFAALARSFSRGASAPQGGQLGEVRRGQLPAEFERVVFNLRSGRVSEVVGSSFGFHIFLVEQRRPARRPGFGEVHEQILQRLIVERERSAVQEEIDRMRRVTAIRMYPENVAVGGAGAAAAGRPRKGRSS